MKTVFALAVMLGLGGLVGPLQAQEPGGTHVKPTIKRSNGTQLRSLNQSLPIRLQLASLDFVNFHSAETSDIKVTGGMVLDKSNAKITASDLTDLQELPEGSLSLSDFEVQFQRPKTNRRIFLDIAVPTGMSVLVYINNQQVLTGPIQEPIAIFKGQKVQGSKNASATFVRAICTGTDSSFPTFPARN